MKKYTKGIKMEEDKFYLWYSENLQRRVKYWGVSWLSKIHNQYMKYIENIYIFKGYDRIEKLGKTHTKYV